MGWGFVADSTPTIEAASSSPATNTYTPSATGNRLIAVLFNSGGTFATGCSDTAGNTWHLDAQIGSLSIFSAPITAGAGSSDTISISGFTANRWIMWVREVSGLSTATGATPLDGTATATGTATAVSSGNTASTTAANEYVFGAVAFDGQPTPVSGGTGFGHVTQDFPASPVKGLLTEDEDSGSAGVQAATATQTGTTVTWSAGCVVYKLATAASTLFVPKPLPYQLIQFPRTLHGATDIKGSQARALQLQGLQAKGWLPIYKPTIQNLLQSLSATLSFTGPTNLKNVISTTTTGGLSFTGSLPHVIGKRLSGVLSFTGPATLPKAITKGMTGGLTFAGSLLRAITKGLSAAALSFAGNLTKQTRTTLTAAALSFAGSLVASRFFARTFTASLSFVGAISRQTGKALTATLSFTGPTKLLNAITKGISGGLTFSGTLLKATKTALASAALSFAGAVTMRTAKPFAAVLSFTGAIAHNNVLKQALTATLSFAGAFAKQTNKKFGGALSFTGALPRAISKGMTGALSFSGQVAKSLSRVLAAALSFNYYYSRVILTDAPAAYWRLDDTDGISAADASGNGHTGTLNGTTPPTRTNGATSDGDAGMVFTNGATTSITVPTAPALHPGDTFSLEFWLLYVAGSKGRGILTAGTGDYSLAIAGSGSGINFGTSSQLIGTLALAYADGLWHHMVWVKSGATSTFYVDGVDVTPAYTDHTVVAASTQLAMGTGGPNGAPNISLDEMAIYGTALSAVQVLAHYNAAFQVSPLTKRTLTRAVAVLSFTGAISKMALRSFSAALTFTGSQSRRILKVLPAALSFSGSALRLRITKGISAALSFIGGFAASGGAIVSGVIAVSALTRDFAVGVKTRSFSGAVLTREYVVSQITRVFSAIFLSRDESTNTKSR